MSDWLPELAPNETRLQPVLCSTVVLPAAAPARTMIITERRRCVDARPVYGGGRYDTHTIPQAVAAIVEHCSTVDSWHLDTELASCRGPAQLA